MDISSVQQGDIQILRLKGDLRRGDAVDSLRTAIEQSIADGRSKIILNVGDVNMIDSSGIGIIVRGHTSCVHNSGGLRLVKPSKFAMQTLKIVGLLNILAIFDEEEQAAESLS